MDSTTLQDSVTIVITSTEVLKLLEFIFTRNLRVP